ncbi:MAG: hypothetical protein QE267_02955 [Akkermansiaceae bacterium]|nr:hypothetical protein [Akkermansiaceae bacterium]
MEFSISGGIHRVVNDVKFDRLIRGLADSPTLIAYLEANFADAHLRDFLLSEAEESPYPLRQWLEALHLFDQWLDTRRLSLPIENQIAYVACSSEGGSAYATLTQLPAQVEEMLEMFGCDEAAPKSPPILPPSASS